MKIYICAPRRYESNNISRKNRIDAVSRAIRNMGHQPVYCDDQAKVGTRTQTVLGCDAIVLDVQWRKDPFCKDEYSVALNHGLKLFHSGTEWKYVFENFIIDDIGSWPESIGGSTQEAMEV